VKRFDTPLRGSTERDAPIYALDGVRRELLLQSFARVFRLGDDQHAARVLVESMDDARTEASYRVARIERSSLETRARKEAGNQRVIPVPPAGVHDDASGLVHDDELFVLVEDLERHRRIWLDVARRRRAWLDVDDGTGADFVTRSARFSVDSHTPFGNPTLNGGSRYTAQEAR